MVMAAKGNVPELPGLLQWQIKVPPAQHRAALTCAPNGAGAASKTPFTPDLQFV